MGTWGNICRVCASPADYDVFEKIPVYLHANSKDFLHWQSPINELMQDITGLKISREDGLPQHICALCISYLKHAFTFREKAIEICMNFIAVKEYKEILKGKKEWNYTKAVNDILTTHNKSLIINENTSAASQSTTAEDDNSTNCYYKDQNKVNKRLITSVQSDNSNMARVLTNQTKSCLLYLSQLYDYPDAGERMGGSGQGTLGLKAKQKRQNMMKSASCDIGGGGGGVFAGGFSRKRQNYEDEFPRNISSDEYDEPDSKGDGSNGASAGDDPHKNNNIFSYKEKIFEEDDIMDIDELKDLISINIESTCKEHKCKYCSRRFMFEDTIKEHLKTCVDFKFAEFFDEIKNLMYIKRCKEISPHEFIRRMVFSIRKTCVWLKENLIDTTLPDLLQSKEASGDSAETDVVNQKHVVPAVRRNPINVSNNVLHLVAKSSAAPVQKVNKTVIGSFLQDETVLNATAVPPTPINMSNNILHEIERSTSRDSNKMVLKKPIAILATSGLNSSLQNMSFKSTTTQNPERLAFLEKLQNAAKPITPPPLSTAKQIADINRTTAEEKQHRNTDISDNTLTPLIAVRQDLLDAATTTTKTTRKRIISTPLSILLLSSSETQNATNTSVNPCARCPTCNLVFDTLYDLEIHNAMEHNNRLKTKTADSGSKSTQNPERLAFLETFQNAAKPITPPPDNDRTPAEETQHRNTVISNNTLTPLITVRQDLLDAATTNTTTTRKPLISTPLNILLLSSSETQNATNTSVNPCARCPTCNLLFDTLYDLEIHNAMEHNNRLMTKASDCGRLSSATKDQSDLEAEHKRIIDLFENGDEF